MRGACRGAGCLRETKTAVESFRGIGAKEKGADCASPPPSVLPLTPTATPSFRFVVSHIKVESVLSSRKIFNFKINIFRPEERPFVEEKGRVEREPDPAFPGTHVPKQEVYFCAFRLRRRRAAAAMPESPVPKSTIVIGS